MSTLLYIMKKVNKIKNLLSNTKPLMGDYMDLLVLTLKKQLSKTSYKI